MASEITSRIRLVKCPKCRKLLPEIADVPVYRCGGCDTILVAKNKKIHSEGASSSGSTQINSPEPANLKQESENKKITSPIHGEQSEGCSPLKKNDPNEDHNNNESDNDELPVQVNSLAELVSRVEINDESLSSPIEVISRPGEESSTDEISPTDDIDSPLLNSKDEVNNESSHSPITNYWPGRNNEHGEASKSQGPRWENDENLPTVNKSPTDSEVSDNKSPPLEINEMLIRRSSQRSSNAEFRSARTSFHAYQSSISSFEGVDEKFRDRNTYETTNPEERLMRRGKFPENEGKFPSNNNHYSTDARMWNQEEMKESGFAGRNYPRFGRGEFPNQFQNRGSSSYSHGRQGNYVDDKNSYLLRMVYELQDQLDHSRQMNNIPNGRRSAPIYYDPEAFEDKIYHGVNPHQRYMEGSFSGEAINNYRHQDWHNSSEFPLSANQRVCHCSNCDLLSYNSCPATPVDFEYRRPVWSRETKSDEKKYLSKRLTQPKVGAAPLIACYICFKLLHLPADFLILKKRCHKLRCGSCLEILQFSLEGRTHIVRYTPNEVVSRNEQQSPVSDSPGPSRSRQPRSGGSPLHRLMGYDSASEVLFTRELTSSASSSANRRQVREQTY